MSAPPDRQLPAPRTPPPRHPEPDPRTPENKRTAPLPRTTPAVLKQSGYYPTSNQVRKMIDSNLDLAIEMAGHFVGPMPVEQFLERFLPANFVTQEVCPESAAAFDRVFPSQPSKFHEVEMYRPFIDAVAPFAPNMRFWDTHAKPDTTARNLAPDVSAYMSDSSPERAETQFSKMSLFIEFKLTETKDPFCDPSDASPINGEFHFEHETEEHMRNRGQIGAYVAALSSCQFRVHVFSVSICGTTARFLRWDRCGTVVSSSFDYIEKPELLSEFFWRYSHLSPHQQGIDTTVSPVIDPAEIQAAQVALGAESDQFLKIRVPNSPTVVLQTSAPAAEQPIHDSTPTVEQLATVPIPVAEQTMYALASAVEQPATHLNSAVEHPATPPASTVGQPAASTVGQPAASTVEHPSAPPTPANDPSVIIALPLVYCPSPFSRATRAAKALDPETKKVVFFKDSWRPSVNLKEGDVYATLHHYKVPYIAEFGIGGDVPNHVTHAQEFVAEDWACHRKPGGQADALLELCNNRMTLNSVGKSLCAFSSSKQMVTAVADAMEAYDGAVFKARILHRDISAGNIIIFEGRGLLIDWDMCVLMSGQTARRTGTWQFMSVALLRDSLQLHTIEDDREYAFYVLLWVALNYSPHTDIPGRTNAASHLRSSFDEFEYYHGEVAGGLRKELYLLSAGEVVSFDNRPILNKLVQALRKAFTARYKAIASFYDSEDDTLQESELGSNEIQEEQFATFQELQNDTSTAPTTKLYTRGELFARLQNEHHARTLQILQKNKWLFTIIRRYLRQDGWLEDDKAVLQERVVEQKTTSHKRVMEQADVDSRKRPRTIH